MEAILRSPTKKSLLQQMGLDDNRITNKDTEDTPARAGSGKGASVATGQREQRRHATGGSNPTPRGMSTGDTDPGAIFPSEGGTAFGGMPMGFPYYPAYHGFHPGMHPCLPPFGMGWGYPMTGPAPQGSTREDSGSGKENPDQTDLDAVGESSRGSRKRLKEEEEDVLSLLDEFEELELVEFDPTIDPNDTYMGATATYPHLSGTLIRGGESRDHEGLSKTKMRCTGCSTVGSTSQGANAAER